MTCGIAMLLLCDVWRVWMVASFCTLYFADRHSADALAPYWWTLLAVVSLYDLISRRRRA